MAMRGRPAFQPTNEQRKNVEVMASLGIPEEKICLVVRNRSDKPISRNSLRKHFKKELETGATQLNARVGHFMVATILGARPPEGMTPITDERVRGRLVELYLKARLGWREIDSNQREDPNERRPIEEGSARRRIQAKLDRLFEALRLESLRRTNSGEPNRT